MTKRVYHRIAGGGAGNEFTVRLVRHRQRKETVNRQSITYEIPRQSSTLHSCNAFL